MNLSDFQSRTILEIETSPQLLIGQLDFWSSSILLNKWIPHNLPNSSRQFQLTATSLLQLGFNVTKVLESASLFGRRSSLIRISPFTTRANSASLSVTTPTERGKPRENIRR
jgi:hypothetical protein